MVALAVNDVLLPLFFLPFAFIVLCGLTLALFSKPRVKHRRIMPPVGWTGNRPTKSKAGISVFQKFYDSSRSEEKVKLFPPWRNKVSKLQKSNAVCENAEKNPGDKGASKKTKAKADEKKNTPPRVIAAEMKKNGFGATVIEVSYNAGHEATSETIPPNEPLKIQTYVNDLTEPAEVTQDLPPDGNISPTIIAVNYNSNEASSEEFDSVISGSDDSLPPLPPKMRDITITNYFKNGTSKRLSHYDNYVHVGNWQTDVPPPMPPPVPPLPSNLREKYQMEAKEEKGSIYGKPSRIPKLNPSPNNLCRVDSAGRKEVDKFNRKSPKHSLFEKPIDKPQTQVPTFPQNNLSFEKYCEEIQKKATSESTKQFLDVINSEDSKNKLYVYKMNGQENSKGKAVHKLGADNWDELFERYEALERECEVADGMLARDQDFESKNFSSLTTAKDSETVNCPPRQETQYSDTKQLCKSNIVKNILQAKIFEDKPCEQKSFLKTNIGKVVEDSKCVNLSVKENSVNCIPIASEKDLPSVVVNKLKVNNSLVEEKLLNGSFGIDLVKANTGRHLGNSVYRTELEIFFRSGVLSQLEAQRDERLSAHVVRLQSRCRGYLARRALARLRLQDAAVRCVQRNVRLLLGVRDWPWWKLLMRVTPLLNVHRTEEQLRQTTDELETLRSKVDKLDTERGQLQHDNDKLGAKLSEMTADLAEEHSTSILATERLEAETSERLRLERELQEIQVHHQSLSATSERLEMELLYLRAADGGQSEDEEGGGGVYKQRYERTLRELELTKHRLQQQHEDDLEQLVALKKQMEKKLADAYEEVNEQRQVVGQWKRKVQKLTAETNDLRLLLEEQNSRNTLLEKKQRRFDSEFQLLQEQFRQEKQNRERASREREMALGEKYTLEQNLSALRLELDLKEEHANSLSRELDELTTGGHTDVEVASLKRAKNEMEKKLQEQEEELDDLAGQLALLGQAKLRLEMSLEQQRKEARREATQRDEELEDVRCNATKKVKALESQLESEHEERTLLLREKHELERRLSAAQDQAGRSQQEQEQVARLKRDLKRTKALLKDAQLMAQKSATDAPAKALLRQLRNQLEDAELARAAAVKGRQGAECELSELQGQLEETQRGRQEAEEKAGAAGRERQDLRTQLDENEEELAEVLKKYRGCVQQLSGEQLAQQEQAAQVVQLECERAALKEQLAELTTRLECAETLGDPGTSLAQRRLELKTREMESRLELEQTTRARLEVQISRLKDAVEKLQAEGSAARAKEQSALCESRKLARSLREVREEAASGAAKEAEAAQRRRDAEGRLEAAQAEAAAAKADLRLALTRINDLQTAIQDDCSQTDSDRDSDSDESIESFLVNHDTTATWDYSRISLSRSPQRHSPSTDLESSKSADLPKTIADSTTKESYA